MKKIVTLILSAALLCSYFPAGAVDVQSIKNADNNTEIGTSIESTSIESAEVSETAQPSPESDIIEPDVTEADVIDEEAAEFAVQNEIMPMGLEVDPDGNPTIDENGYITSTYGYTLKGDPYNTTMVKEGKEYSAGNKKLHDPYWLKDENFFGKWNSQAGKWDIVGKFDYDNYEELGDVEEAVKAGDYDAAKLAIYNYYIELERKRGRKKDTSNTKKDQITADLLMKNYMYNANSGITPLELMYVDNTPKYVSADITDTITKYLGTRQNLTFWITSTDKNGDSAIFKSKEGGEDTRPYLKIKVNGTERIIYPSDDTMIKAGDNKTKNYGKDEELVAREDGIKETQTLVNSDTSRIYLKFDVSELVAGDTVTAATFNIYGNNEVEGKEREVVLFYSDDSNWKESNATYGNVTAQVIFSYDQLDTWLWNQPTSAGYRYQEELLRFNTWFDKLVKLYNATGDEKYAYTALREFLDYINVRGDDFCWLKSLDVAVRTQCMPGLMLQLIESDYMTPDVFTGFLKWVWVQANGAKYFTRDGNWGTSESQGLYTVAINFQEFTDSIAWINVVRRRYETLSNALIKSDLACTELSLGYTDYSIDTLVGAKSAADAIDAFSEEKSPYTEKTLENIKGLGLFEYYSSMPGVADNQVGDGYSHRGNFKSRMLSLGEWFNDPHLLYAGSDGKQGTAPDFTSKLFPVGLKAVMRTNWDDDAMYFFTDADGGFGNHSHPDDNSIVISAYGQYLLVDPLYGTYSASAAKTWLTSTIAHNVVTMNGKNQYSNNSSAKKGTIPRWETNDSYDFVTTDTPNTQDASSYKRSTLFVRNHFWLVNDYLVPSNSNSNKYVQPWHFLPEANISIDEDTKTVRTNMSGVNVQVVPVGADEFDRADIVKGLYSEGQGSVSDAYYSEYEKNGSGPMVFNTFIFPENRGEEYDIVTSKIPLDNLSETEASAYEIYLQDKNTDKITHYQYYLLHDRAKKTTVAVDNYVTDASMLFAEIADDGATKYVIAQDATYLKNKDNVIFESETEIPEISIEWNKSICEIDGSGLTVDVLKTGNVIINSAGETINKVTLNGSEVSFTQVDEQLYFGTAPTPNPSASVKPTTKPTKPPVHGGGGGSSGSSGGGIITPNKTPSPTVVPSVDPTEKPETSATPETSQKPVMTENMKKELENHWGKNEITELFEDGIITGQTDDSLGLSNNITRSEFITLIVRANDLELKEYGGEFGDVKADDWYADYIQTAYEAGYINGTDGNALPNEAITREEMAKILANAIDKTPEKEPMQFEDEQDVSSWAKDAVDKVSSLGIINGFENGSFEPKQNTKRDEAFVVIYRMLNLK